MKIILRIFLMLLLLSPSILWAEETSDLRKEIEELKLRLEVVEATNEDVDDRFSKLFTLSGYADSEYIIDDSSGTTDGFRTHHLSFHFIKQISDKWRLFSEVEFEDSPKIGETKTETTTASAPANHTHDVEVTKNNEGKIFVEVFTIDYNHNPYLNIRAGRYLTPAGIWNVEHYPPFVSTQERPQHIRNIFPQVSDGLQFFGTANLGSVVTDYILYVSNGSGNSGDGDENDNKAIGGRLKLKLPLLSRTEIGLSSYNEKNNSNPEEKVNAYGVDLSFQWKRLKFQAEYATGSYDLATGTDYDRKGYYGQLLYGIADFDLIYRYDWYDDDDDPAVDEEKTINSVALNYHFTPSVVGKVEHHLHDYEDSDREDEDYDKTVLSVAVYLGE